MDKSARIAVLGDGGWGTTLALLLNKKGFDVTLWGAFREYVEKMSASRENKKFLPGIKLPFSILLTYNIEAAAGNNDLIVLAAPSQHMRSVLKKIPLKTARQAGKIYVSAAKGIENKTLFRMSEVIRDVLGDVNVCALSGPTISYEAARGVPTTAVAASRDEKIAKRIQEVFCSETFRIYTTPDITGVELGGSLKNIVAIAAGIADGLGFGTNSKAALLTRGLVEISRLGEAMGARRETFYGLSGLGDLVTTCINPHGRNRWFGEQIGKGRGPRQILKKTEMVIEGAPTAKSAYNLAKKNKIEMPIARQVYNILYRGKSPEAAVRELMLRPMKKE